MRDDVSRARVQPDRKVKLENYAYREADILFAVLAGDANPANSIYASELALHAIGSCLS